TQVQQHLARLQVPLDPAPGAVAPVVQPYAAGGQPRPGAPGALEVDPGDLGASAGAALAGEAGAEVARAFARLALGETGVGPGFPLPGPRGAAHGQVRAPTGRRSGVLVVGQGRARSVVGHRRGTVGEVAVAAPGLHAPAPAA